MPGEDMSDLNKMLKDIMSQGKRLDREQNMSKSEEQRKTEHEQWLAKREELLREPPRQFHCPYAIRKPRHDDYCGWHLWADEQGKKGIKQQLCSTCELWCFPEGAAVCPHAKLLSDEQARQLYPDRFGTSLEDVEPLPVQTITLPLRGQQS